MRSRIWRAARWAALIVAIGAAPPSALWAVAAPGWWTPGPQPSWQIQISSTPKTILPVAVYDVDLFETPPATIDAMHDRGIKVICYFSAGSYENWRPDKDEFPRDALGNKLGHWPGERWLDIRSDVVFRIMQERIDLARQKKCDAVDPDNVDVATNHPGFPITLDEQLDYILRLANAAHDAGLAIGLKNDVEQIPRLVGDVDFTVNEECFKYHECDTLQPFTAAGKPVFQIEYGRANKARKICPQANALGFATLIKKLNLGAQRIACADWPAASESRATAHPVFA
ncbi:MAG TPA: endo alpha-1,4 polygalactosaminidase [Thermomicrobiales bacterium]|jgi:hypothetical protein|nr:endo alpha-1,4 polygalactosaminidase [Thermomicrobiales bacterium]